MTPHRHVVMFSAGGGSWAAAKRVVAQHGSAAVTLLFTDTLFEDEDAYRFLLEGAANVLGVTLPRQFVPRPEHFPDFEDRPAYKLFLAGLRQEAAALLPGLVWLARGLDIWDVFRKERFLGNSSFDPCSKLLKRQMADAWHDEHCDPASTTVYVGIDWSEGHRFDDGEGGGVRPRRAAQGWTYEAPMMVPPYLWPHDVFAWMEREGIERPRLYRQGFHHDNCRGGCVKQGQGGFANLLRVNRRFYLFLEGQELDIRDYLGADVSMLTDRSGGAGKRPLTLRAFRERIEGDQQLGLDLDELRACGCFLEAAA